MMGELLAPRREIPKKVAAWSVGWAILLLLGGCATAPPRPSTPKRSARDYAPLPVGAIWTYEMRYPGQTGDMTVRIVGEKDGFVVDDKNGAFQHTAEGLRDRDRYLLRHPIEAGTRWTSVVGPSAVEHLAITSAGKPCDSAAGRFEDCVVVDGALRRDKTMTLHIQWTWARGIGLVKVETEAEVAGKGRVPQVRQSLKEYWLSGAAEAKPDAGKDDGPNTWVSE